MLETTTPVRAARELKMLYRPPWVANFEQFSDHATDDSTLYFDLNVAC